MKLLFKVVESFYFKYFTQIIRLRSTLGFSSSWKRMRKRFEVEFVKNACVNKILYEVLSKLKHYILSNNNYCMDHNHGNIILK